MSASSPHPDRLRRALPFLAWPRPTAHVLRTESVAGLTVALILIPQGVAYAALAGMPLVSGLYAALLPALLGVLWSGSSRLSVGPTALTCLLVSASLTGLAPAGSAQWVTLAIWLAVLSGLLQVGLGLGRFGWLLNLISAPVLMGFTQAAGLLIMASQLPALLGITQPLAAWVAAPEVDWRSAGFGLISLAILAAGKRWRPHWPLIMVLVLGTAALSSWLALPRQGLAVIGALPAGLPTLAWPQWPGWDALGALVVPAMVIALVSFLETASSAKAENQRDGTRWNDNQDLIGQGLAKLASALSGSFPTSASFSRSALNLYAGARTGWSSVITVVCVWLTLVLFMPALGPVPRAVLAAVVIAAVSGLIEPRNLVRLWRIAPVEGVTALLTFAVTLLTAPRMYWGVAAGVLMGLSHFLYHRLHPRVIEVGQHPDGSLRDRNLLSLPPLGPHLYAVRMDAELDFAAASGLELAITEHLSTHPDVRHLCLFAQPINRIDATGVELFGQLRRRLRASGISLHISGIKLPVLQVLQRAGELPAPGEPLPEGLVMYRTDLEAVQHLALLEK